MPDKTSLFDRAMPVLASLDIAASLEYFHELGFETYDFGDSNYGIAIREHIEIHFWLCREQARRREHFLLRPCERHSCAARGSPQAHRCGRSRRNAVGYGRTVCVRPERQPGEIRSGDGQVHSGEHRAGSALGTSVRRRPRGIGSDFERGDRPAEVPGEEAGEAAPTLEHVVQGTSVSRRFRTSLGVVRVNRLEPPGEVP